MKVPKGNWLAIGIALGSGIGVVMDNIGIGIVIGTVVGATIDSLSQGK